MREPHDGSWAAADQSDNPGAWTEPRQAPVLRSIQQVAAVRARADVRASRCGCPTGSSHGPAPGRTAPPPSGTSPVGFRTGISGVSGLALRSRHAIRGFRNWPPDRLAAVGSCVRSHGRCFQSDRCGRHLGCVRTGRRTESGRRGSHAAVPGPAGRPAEAHARRGTSSLLARPVARVSARIRDWGAKCPGLDSRVCEESLVGASIPWLPKLRRGPLTNDRISGPALSRSTAHRWAAAVGIVGLVAASWAAGYLAGRRAKQQS